MFGGVEKSSGVAVSGVRLDRRVLMMSPLEMLLILGSLVIPVVQRL